MARWRHLKRGSVYSIVGRGKIQTDTPLTDMAEVVVYVPEYANPFGDDTEVWVRPVEEFFDGRFEKYDPPPIEIPDELTADEISLHRTFKVFTRRQVGNYTDFGIRFAATENWCGIQFVIKLIWVDIVFRFMTFEEYKRRTLAMGPSRNF